jgi:hypothetical protein
MRSTAARFELSPERAQCEYAGLFGMGTGTAAALGPTILGFACVTWGSPGRASLGAVMVIAGMLTPLRSLTRGRARPKLR